MEVILLAAAEEADQFRALSAFCLPWAAMHYYAFLASRFAQDNGRTGVSPDPNMHYSASWVMA
jgi:hypothetical protein